MGVRSEGTASRGLHFANEATTRQYVKVNDVALGQAQLIRSSHFGGQQRAKSSSSENMDENFFIQAFEEYMESEEFEELCSQPSASLSQCKKPRVQVDPAQFGVENGGPIPPIFDASSSSGKSTTLNFSFVINKYVCVDIVCVCALAARRMHDTFKLKI